MEYREERDLQRGFLEKQCYNLNYEFWEKNYMPAEFKVGPDGTVIIHGEAEEPVTDIASVDEWWESLGEKREVTGREILNVSRDSEGWI